MKIGILTLHSNTNFGGGLQQIALVEVLKSLGHDPQVLCVESSEINEPIYRRCIGVLSQYTLRDIIKETKKRLFRKKKEKQENYSLYRRCDDFNYKNLNYTPKFGFYELANYCKRYDALIVGSDQVWTNVYSETNPFFLDGIGDFNGKKISYAACSAHDTVPFFNRKHIKNSLSLFSEISVRDTTTAKLVESLGLTSPKIVADPTLLYDFGKYLEPSNIKEPYIFAYVLGEMSNEWHEKNIAIIRNKIGNIKVVALTVELDSSYPWADIVLNDVVSVEWMNILRGSSFVYTNSYHAVIFSLKFHIDFVAYYGDIVRSSRMLGLQEQFNLKKRIVSDPASVNYDEFICFEESDKIMTTLVCDSINWLKTQLSI